MQLFLFFPLFIEVMKMARPRKTGLSYFPLDVDIFQDEKLFDLQNKYGPLGEVIYLRLLCIVYKNGYFFRFDDIDKLAALMIRSIGSQWARDKKTVKDVILFLAKTNLFSAELMQRNVMTSRGIQERYLTALGRRQSQIGEYSLVGKNFSPQGGQAMPEEEVSVAETPVIVAETPVSVAEIPIKKSKEKLNEIKLNKRKMSYSYSEMLNLTQEQYDELCGRFGSKAVNGKIEKLTEWQAANQRLVLKPYEVITEWIMRNLKGATSISQLKTNGHQTSYDLGEWEKYAASIDLEANAPPDDNTDNTGADPQLSESG